jgi:DNA repair protein RadC
MRTCHAATRTGAAKNVRAGIDDVLRTNGNAVMLWHAHPSDADLALIQGCLKT